MGGAIVAHQLPITRCLRIQWAAHTPAATFDDMGVDHRGLDVFVTKQFLNGANIVTILQQMGGERVATGIITLLINRSPIESTTAIIPTTVKPSISSGACDGSTMKRSL